MKKIQISKKQAKQYIIGKKRTNPKTKSIQGHGINKRNAHVVRSLSHNGLTLDDKIDASRILSGYVKMGVLDFKGCSSKTRRYIVSAVTTRNASKRLEQLNRDIINENKKINKPTVKTLKAYRKLTK